MLAVGPDVVLLFSAGAIIACFVAVVARCCGMDKETVDNLAYTSMATSFLLIVAYVAISFMLDSLC